MYFLGVDLGTSSVKLVLIDENINVIKTVSKDYPLYMPQDGYSEQNPIDWYNGSIEGLKELLKDIDKSQVKGISFGGQMHGLVALDKDDNVIRPAILWNDGRTGKETDYLNNVIGKEYLVKHTGNIAFTGFTAPKILWMKDNEPEKFSQIQKIMLPKDYLAYRLSGTFATDPSDASGTLLFDVENRCWSKEMLDICGVNIEWLPKIFESYEVIGTIKEDIAKELGLNKDVKVIIGAGDNAAAAIGTGTVKDGSCNISLGTSGTIFISTDKFVGGKGDKIHSFAHANGKYHLMGCILSAASCNKWWTETILKDDYDNNDYTARLGKNNVFFLPYLMGERSPHNDEKIRGAFVGLSLSTDRVDLNLAILEGVAFAIRDCFEIAKNSGIVINSSTVVGGGAKNPLWLKILANVLNIEIYRNKSEQGPGLGSAILAGQGCGVLDAVSSGFTSEVIKPDKEIVELYNERYNKFVKIYPQLKPLF